MRSRDKLSSKRFYPKSVLDIIKKSIRKFVKHALFKMKLYLTRKINIIEILETFFYLYSITSLNWHLNHIEVWHYKANTHLVINL